MSYTKAIFILISLYFISTGFAYEIKKETDTVSVRYEVNEIKAMELINNLKIIVSSQPSHVSKRFLYIKEKIDDGKLIILTKHNNINADIRNVSCFYPPNTEGYHEKIPAIALSSYLYDLFEKHPSLAHAIMVHEICHAYDYFTNEAGFMLLYSGNELEGFMYEMDAIYLEAMFVNDCIDTLKYKLTNFEKFLLDSYKYDALTSLSIHFKNVDYNIARNMYELTTSELSCVGALEKLNLIGDSLLNVFNYPQNGSLQEMYLSIIPIFTYCRFGPQSVRNIVCHKSKNVKDENFKIENYPSNYNKIVELTKMISPYTKYISTYNDYMDSLFFRGL